jgi:galactonate dehydratase
VHRLLGGPVRDRVRMYAWIGGDRPGDVAELAKEQVQAGFTAVKMNGSAELAPIDAPARTAEVVERVAAVREVLGDERDIAVDFHGRVSTAMARRLLPLLEPLHPMFVEEPVLPEHSGHLRSLVESTSVPLATGERLYSRWDFRDVLTSGIAVAQPTCSTRAASPRSAGSRPWPKRTTWPWRRTAPSAPSPWPQACRSPSRYRTSSSRNRAWASTTTSSATCWTM